LAVCQRNPCCLGYDLLWNCLHGVRRGP
jgi:hypothetical protein